MTRLLLAPAFILLASACAPDPDPVPLVGDVGTSAADTATSDAEYLNPERDPEGNSLLGEPGGMGEAPGSNSTNDDRDGNDPIETADEDTTPPE